MSAIPEVKRGAARRRSLARRAALAALAAVLLGAAASAGRALQSMRAGAAASAASVSETPWVRYVMVGLGGFRGIVSEVLWIRADRLQEQGRYFELAQLSEWINSLDPRAADAWAFSAWNLAYNIGAMVPGDEAKLHWLLQGISLLRDKAMAANPGAPSLYRELGWLYQNKIGGSDDPANQFYKFDLAIDASRGEGERRHPLDPGVVAEIEGRFGPLDWRLAPSHAIYWAWRGLALNPQGFDRAGLNRMIHQSLVMLIGAGEFTGDAARGVWQTRPDWALVRPTMAFFDETMTGSDGEVRVYRIFLAALAERLAAAGETELADAAASRLGELGGPLDSNLPQEDD